MPAEVFQYTVLQVVPRVERGERFNAGVVVHSRRHRFLAARVALDRIKLHALAPEADAAEVEPRRQAYIDALMPYRISFRDRLDVLEGALAIGRQAALFPSEEVKTRLEAANRVRMPRPQLLTMLCSLR